MRNLKLGFVALCLSSSLNAAPVEDAKVLPVLKNYSANVYVTYDLALTKVVALNSAIQAFLANPSEKTLQEAKKAWFESREVWGQTEVYRFYEGPIDDASYGVEGLINAWPLDEAYIDYVVGNPTAGIINDPINYPTLTTETLLSANENGAETNVATGFHAIEFLLWGQDLSKDGPGQRPYTDFVVGEGKNAERRAQYLRVVTELLLTHVTTVRDAWSSTDAQSYGAQFDKQDPKDSLLKVFKGMTSLLTDELAGERMYVGYESKSQEDEHSCFSDNTHVDIIENIQGVINVWNGSFGTSVGESPRALVDAAVAKKVDRALAAALANAQALPTPFDSLLIAEDESEERKLLLETILSIQDAGSAIRAAAESLGVEIPVE